MPPADLFKLAGASVYKRGLGPHLLGPQWEAQSDAGVFVKAVDDYKGQMDVVHLNPRGNCTADNARKLLFSPPYCTSWSIKMDVCLPAGVTAAQTFKVRITRNGDASTDSTLVTVSKSTWSSVTIGPFKWTDGSAWQDREATIEIFPQTTGTTTQAQAYIACFRIVTTGVPGLLGDETAQQIPLSPRVLHDNVAPHRSGIVAARSHGAHNAGARAVIVTDSDSIAVQVQASSQTYVGNGSVAAYWNLGVYVNGRFWASVPVSGQHGYDGWAEVRLPRGLKRVDVQASGQIIPQTGSTLVVPTIEGGAGWGIWLKALHVDGDAYASIMPPTGGPTTLVVGNSLTTQGAENVASTFCEYLRQSLPGPVIDLSMGALSYRALYEMGKVSGTPQWDYFVGLVAAARPSLLILNSIETNDHGLSTANAMTWSAANMQLALQELLQMLLLACPGMQIAVVTAYPRSTTAANLYGDNVTAYRTAAAAAVTFVASSRVQAIAGTSIVAAPADLAGDDLHLADGSAIFKAARNTLSALRFTAT